ncbi:MAG: hypothetical protein K6F09_02720 [Clostridiales bacterium]|nr:hypothetical protein [Clostridiales bacterium]
MLTEKTIIENILADKKTAKRDFDEIKDRIMASDLHVGDRCVQTLSVPKIFTEKDVGLFKNITETCFSIFDKVIHEYLVSPAYRALFPFSKELRELILSGVHYKTYIPISRIDIFFNEETGDFKFCEINTDGTSAMNEDRILNSLLPLNTAFMNAAEGEEYYSFELFDSWVAEFKNIYDTYDNKRTDSPHVAIADFNDRGTANEFIRFEEAFKRNGISAEICDIRSFSYKNGSLKSPSGKRVDAVYRRAVTADIMDRYDEVTPFISAVKDNAVCVIGSFPTQIIHNKYIFAVLHFDETKKLLSKSENDFIAAHIPATYVLNDENIEKFDAAQNRSSWLIKPFDLYASRGVYAGIDLSPKEWKNVLSKGSGKNYLLQEYCPPYVSENIDFSEKDAEIRGFRNITGLFCYNRKFSGIYSRLSKGGIISSQYDEKTIATIVKK